ncbi:MAG: HD domain-containing protein [Nanoarchaeota archaeon]
MKTIAELAYKVTINPELEYHPWEHTKRVARFAENILINEFNDESIYNDILIAAYFHDSGRIHDPFDPEHGFRSAMILDSYKDKINYKFDIESVRYAIINHCRKEGENGQMPVIQNMKNDTIDMRIAACLWDADRLDLIRHVCFPYVKKEFLSTQYARDFANSKEHRKIYNL